MYLVVLMRSETTANVNKLNEMNNKKLDKKVLMATFDNWLTSLKIN
jgi:hypothetical protein